jgi:hypothetical protein
VQWTCRIVEPRQDDFKPVTPKPHLTFYWRGLVGSVLMPNAVALLAQIGMSKLVPLCPMATVVSIAKQPSTGSLMRHYAPAYRRAYCYRTAAQRPSLVNGAWEASSSNRPHFTYIYVLPASFSSMSRRPVPLTPFPFIVEKSYHVSSIQIYLCVRPSARGKVVRSRIRRRLSYSR